MLGSNSFSVAAAAGRVPETMNKAEPVSTDQPAKKPIAGEKIEVSHE